MSNKRYAAVIAELAKKAGVRESVVNSYVYEICTNRVHEFIGEQVRQMIADKPIDKVLEMKGDAALYSSQAVRAVVTKEANDGNTQEED